MNTTSPISSLPVGLFDSGVGGLTVFKAIHSLLPCENLLYLGDTARVPYGTKSPQTIARYTLMAARCLASYGVKMLVIACNTATSAALPIIAREFAPTPVLGVVEPGAQAAVATTRNGRIAVIATEATIQGNAYQDAISRLLPDACVISRACTMFVPLAEEGWLEGEVAESVIRRYLGDIFGLGTPPVTARPDTLLLGCTHFPLFMTALQKLIGSDAAIVDSAQATARHVQSELERLHILNTGNAPGRHRFLTTDNPARFAHTGSLFLGRNLLEKDIELVELAPSHSFLP